MTHMTVEQFRQLPQVTDDDYRRFELWQGELVQMGETTPFHNWIRDRLLRLIGNLAESATLWTVPCETGVLVDSNTLYRPTSLSGTPRIGHASICGKAAWR